MEKIPLWIKMFVEKEIIHMDLDKMVVHGNKGEEENMEAKVNQKKMI
jgi:hypothetical protein